MTTVVLLIHLAILCLIGVLVYVPELIANIQSTDETTQEGSESPQASSTSTAALCAAGIGCIGLLLDLFGNSGTGKLPWYLLEGLLILLGISAAIPSVSVAVHSQFRNFSGLIRSALQFFLNSNRNFGRRNQVRKSNESQISVYLPIYPTFRESSRKLEDPTRFHFSDACAHCGSQKELIPGSKTFKLRGGEGGFLFVIIATGIGLVIDLRFSLGSSVRQSPYPVQMIFGDSPTFWLTGFGFLFSCIVTYLLAAVRYIQVDFSLCQLHQSNLRDYPIPLVIDKGIYLEFGLPKVRGIVAKPLGLPSADAAELSVDSDESQDRVIQPKKDSLNTVSAGHEPSSEVERPSNKTQMPFSEEGALIAIKLKTFHEKGIAPLAFSEDGRRLVACSVYEDSRASKANYWIRDLQSDELLKVSKVKLFGKPIVSGHNLYLARLGKKGSMEIVSMSLDTVEETIQSTITAKRYGFRDVNGAEPKFWELSNSEIGAYFFEGRVHLGGQFISYDGHDHQKVVLDTKSGAKAYVVPDVYDTSRTFGNSVQGPFVVSPSGAVVAYLARGRFFVTLPFSTFKIKCSTERPKTDPAALFQFVPESYALTKIDGQEIKYERFALAMYGNELELWDLTKNECVWDVSNFKRAYGKITSVDELRGVDWLFSFSKDLKYCLMHCRNEAVLCRFSLTARPVVLARLESKYPVIASAFSPDGTQVALADRKTNVTLWELRKG